MNSQIFDLIALQKVDTAIQAEKATIAKVPHDIAKVDATIQEYRDKLAISQNALEEARKERRTLEGELQTINDKQAKYETQLMDVKSNEAYRAMLKEIETTKKDIDDHEEKILEDMLSVDKFEEEIAVLEKDFESDRTRLEEEKTAAEELGRVAAERLEVHQEERVGLASALEELQLREYEKVLRQRSGLAIARIEEDLCLGCRVKVRLQICQEVRQGEIHHCDSCGRFLYFREEFDPRNESSPPAGEPAGTSPTKPTPG